MNALLKFCQVALNSIDANQGDLVITFQENSKDAPDSNVEKKAVINTANDLATLLDRIEEMRFPEILVEDKLNIVKVAFYRFEGEKSVHDSVQTVVYTKYEKGLSTYSERGFPQLSDFKIAVANVVEEFGENLSIFATMQAWANRGPSLK